MCVRAQTCVGIAIGFEPSEGEEKQAGKIGND
jgi:hypothetical protein